MSEEEALVADLVALLETWRIEQSNSRSQPRKEAILKCSVEVVNLLRRHNVPVAEILLEVQRSR